MATLQTRPLAALSVPPLPGATWTLLTRVEAARLNAMACSLPPLPMTSTSTRSCVVVVCGVRAFGSSSSSCSATVDNSTAHSSVADCCENMCTAQYLLSLHPTDARSGSLTKVSTATNGITQLQLLDGHLGTPRRLRMPAASNKDATGSRTGRAPEITVFNKLKRFFDFGGRRLGVQLDLLAIN
eukprot:5554-Heterococcus_DN1.PRE.2